MELINALVLIAGGILAASGLIIAKKPDAKQLIDKLMPYQAIIGVVLLALGILNLLRWIGSVFGLITEVHAAAQTQSLAALVGATLNPSTRTTHDNERPPPPPHLRI